MNKAIDILFDGFPGKSDRGFLGWSSAVLLQNGRLGLFDTAGFGERIELVHRLQSRNIQPQDINFIILSHFHFDHVANISLFPQATIYLHESEIHHVLEDSSKDLAVPVELFYPLHASNRLVILHGEKGVVEGYKWFHTPGHTPGCISIFIQHEGAIWVLAADAIKNLLEAQTGEVWMSTNPQASRDSIKKILHEADWIIPGHDRVLHINHSKLPFLVEAVSQTTIKIELTKNYPGEITTQTSHGDFGDNVTIGLGEPNNGV